MSPDRIGLIVASATSAPTPGGHRRSVMAPDAAEHDEVSGKDEREHADVSRGGR